LILKVVFLFLVLTVFIIYLLTRYPLHLAWSRTICPLRCLNLWLRILLRIRACILMYPVRICMYFLRPLYALKFFWMRIAEARIFKNRRLNFSFKIYKNKTKMTYFFHIISWKKFNKSYSNIQYNKLQGVPRNMTVGKYIFFHKLLSCLIPKTKIKILYRSHIIGKLTSK